MEIVTMAIYYDKIIEEEIISMVKHCKLTNRSLFCVVGYLFVLLVFCYQLTKCRLIKRCVGLFK